MIGNPLRLLDRDRTIAGPGFNRWLIPPAALAVHLCIGEVYGFSVFNEPLTRVVGITRSVPGEDWTIPQVGWIYSIALIMLGLSAALFGRWVERVGPRKTMAASACCFCGGLLVAALGVRLHNIWVVYLGYGLIGGIGLGLGYIAPVSTLVKWFPDRPGMATGLAIMGFGGGALVGAPLGVELMGRFRSSTSVGVAEAFAVMACGYFALMIFGAAIVRVPHPSWRPEGYAPPARPRRLVTHAHVAVDAAWKTPQFWLLWAVLCLNVTAGIGILGQASLMCQDMFGVSAAVGAGYAGLLSLSNMGGRFFWSSISDLTGRKAIYGVYFLLGAALYGMIPFTQQQHSVALVRPGHGGHHLDVRRRLRDDPRVSPRPVRHDAPGRDPRPADHRVVDGGRAGPATGQLPLRRPDQGRRAPAEAYNLTMYLMSGLLLVGFVCNLMVRPVDERHHHDERSLES